MSKISIVDYETGGNIFSLCNSLSKIGVDFEITKDPQTIDQASKIIFPGVGSFGSAMASLERLGLIEVLQAKARQVPFLGVCVGMQVLFEQGLEGGSIPGLGVIPGKVEKFTAGQDLKIPHMGWNSLDLSPSPLYKGIEDASQVYFVHSYRIKADYLPEIRKAYPKSQIATTNYGIDFISSFWDGDKLFACQFHPEKSGEIGLRLLKNFAEL